MSLTSGSWSGRGWLGEALLQCGKTMEEDARLFLVQGAGGFSGPRDSGGLPGEGTLGSQAGVRACCGGWALAVAGGKGVPG